MLNVKYKITKEVEENISEYVYSLEDVVEGLSKHDTKSVSGNSVKYDFINKSKAFECQNTRLVKLKDK